MIGLTIDKIAKTNTVQVRLKVSLKDLTIISKQALMRWIMYALVSHLIQVGKRRVGHTYDSNSDHVYHMGC